MGARKKSVFKPKPCDECRRRFSPQAARSRYCNGCKQNKTQQQADRKLTAARGRYNQITGRVCRWCACRDRDAGFKTKDECNNCYANSQRNGRCIPCEGRPLNKQRDKTMPSCPECGLPGAGSGYVPIILLCNGEAQTVFRSKNSGIFCHGESLPVSEILKISGMDHLEMVVEENAFSRGWSSRPVTIKLAKGWVSPVHFGSWAGMRALSVSAKWPRGVRKTVHKNEDGLSDDMLYFLYEIAHFIELGEADPMTFKWWRWKFRKGFTKQASQRYWERMKVRLRKWVTIDMVDPYTGALIESKDHVGSFAIRFRKHELRMFVKRHMAERDQKTA